MKIDYILKEIQNANHNIIEAHSYMSHYKYKKTYNYLHEGKKSIIMAKEIINALIDKIKEMEEQKYDK